MYNAGPCMCMLCDSLTDACTQHFISMVMSGAEIIISYSIKECVAVFIGFIKIRLQFHMFGLILLNVIGLRNWHI